MRVPLDPITPVRPRGGASAARPATGPGRLAAVLIAVVAIGSWFATTASAQADPTTSPVTTISPDGRTGTDGTRTLALAQAADLDGTGSTMSVSGSGYDENKGVYVALCVIPPPNRAPSPCGGGVDTEGTQGASQWISSNPPSYGAGLARPYGPGGSFQTSFTVRSEISPGIDCRQVRCAVVTRNDHTRTSDRSQDILVPVTFRAAPAVTVPPTAVNPTLTVPGEPAPTTTPTIAPLVTIPPLANPTTTVPAPTATVSDDGTTATDGTRTLMVTRVADLDPEQQTVTVRGRGFDEARGIYVSLCAVTPGAAPGPCRTGSAEANRWISSDPPDYGVGVATPFGAGGTFEVDLAIAAVIDAEADCRVVACAVLTRADDTAADDRTLDLAVPVSFAATSTATSAPATTEPAATTTDDVAEGETESASSIVIDEGSSSAVPLVAGLAVAAVLALAAGGVLAARRRPAAGSGAVVTTVAVPAPTDGAEPAQQEPS